MLWLLVVIISQFCNAGAQLLDKFLLSKNFPRPAILTFWTSLAGFLGVVFVFGDFRFFPGWVMLGLALLSGVFFTIALQFGYTAMKTSEVSHISPFMGGVVAIVTYALSFWLLAERLTVKENLAVIFLVLGVFLISFEKSAAHNGWHRGLLWALVAGIFFALSYVAARWVYLSETFATGFVWGRVGALLTALPLLFSRGVRQEIFGRTTKRQNARQGLLILAVNKILAALYFIGMNFALSLASATLVNALAGLQYVILFVLIFAFSKLKPQFFREKFTRGELIAETSALVAIVVGLGLML